MTGPIKTLAAGVGLSMLCHLPVYADGVDEMFSADGGYIDDIEIVGDATLPSGEELAVFVMRGQHMRFLVDPAAAYVSVDPSTPAIANQTPFYGYWVSTQSPDVGDWPVCDYAVKDDLGASHTAHGTLVWTNLGVAADGYSLAFGIDLGTCSNRQEPWAYSRAAIEMSPDAGVPHRDIAD